MVETPLLSFSFEVNGLPQGKARARTVTKDQFGRRLARPRTFTPKETERYQSAVAFAALEAMRESGIPEAFKGPVRVAISARWGESPGVLVTVSELGLGWETRAPDSDNIAKIVCDALNKLAFEDDRQVACLFVEKLLEEGRLPTPKIDLAMKGSENMLAEPLHDLEGACVTCKKVDPGAGIGFLSDGSGWAHCGLCTRRAIVARAKNVQ